MQELKNDIKTKRFQRVYLLFGGERYLAEHYAASLMSAAVAPEGAQMNIETFAGKACSVDAAIDAAETTPFMSDYRMVVMNDSGLFTAGRKADSEQLAAYLPDIPDSTVMLFLEAEVDKRGRLYKQAAALGRAVECKTPSEKELFKWLENVLKKEGKRLSPSAAQLFLRISGGDMRQLYNEAQKLAAYADGDVIEEVDVEAVCVKNLEARIFDLVACVGNKNAPRALAIFNNMLLMKESPIMVLVMIARQLRLVLRCGYLAGQGHSQDEIAERLGLRTFAVRDYLGQSRNFTTDGLIAALRAALEADYQIKTGRITDRLAVEMLILSLADGGMPPTALSLKEE